MLTTRRRCERIGFRFVLLFRCSRESWISNIFILYSPLKAIVRLYRSIYARTDENAFIRISIVFFSKRFVSIIRNVKKKHILKRKRRECLRSKFEMNQICIKSIFSPNAFHEPKATSLDIQIICEIDRNESSSIFFFPISHLIEIYDMCVEGDGRWCARILFGAWLTTTDTCDATTVSTLCNRDVDGVGA